jgi:arabinosaccharide transport system substrate-binding protein
MMGITKACRNPELAWKLLDYLYFSEAGLRARQDGSEIIPPISTLWDDPYYHQPDPFFGGQRSRELFIKLAPEIPTRYVTPASSVASLALNDAVVRATRYVRDHGEEGLEENCRVWLADIAHDLRRRIEQWRFDR